MNIFSLLFIALSAMLVLAGAILLIVAFVKKNWKLAALAILGPVAGWAVMIGVGLIAISSPDIQLKREVSKTEVIGVWLLRSESLDLAKKEGYEPPSGAVHRIDIMADGTCHYRSIWSYPTRFAEHEGTWRIEPAVGKKHVSELGFTTTENGRSMMFSSSFAEEGGRLVIWEYLGDPDSGTYLKFDKQPTEKPQPTPPRRSR
jgi:hypothetical protein